MITLSNIKEIAENNNIYVDTPYYCKSGKYRVLKSNDGYRLLAIYE